MTTSAGAARRDLAGDLGDWARAWWFLVLTGVVSVIAGIVVLVQPDISLATLAVVTGIFLLMTGVFAVMTALASPPGLRGAIVLGGIVSMIAGMMLVRHPIEGVVAVALVLGIWLVAFGVLRFMAALDSSERRGWNFFVAAVETIAGIVIVGAPGIGVGTLAVVVSIVFVLRGIGMIAEGWALRSRHARTSPRAGAVGQH
jgi:uncharacterized membrane protein HdeD (DUF308 family)